MRGTTPYHSFILPLKSEQIDEIYVTYLQNDRVILDKSTEDVVINDIVDLYENASMEELTEEELNSCQVTLHLSQEDTLAFKFYPAAEKNIAVIQVRLLTTDGEAYGSDPVTERIMGILKDGVIPPEQEEEP
jgi:hypothetical protein